MVHQFLADGCIRTIYRPWSNEPGLAAAFNQPQDPEETSPTSVTQRTKQVTLEEETLDKACSMILP